MKLPLPFIQLPLLFDADALAAEIGAIPESSWMPHPQGFAGNSMLPLVAAGGDPDDERFSGVMQPTAHLQRCPYLMQVLASLGANIGRTRLMRLSGFSEVTRHADQGYYWGERVRVHVPIVTQPTVRFYCGDAEVNMGAGEAWIFDTWRPHYVINDDTRSRIHLVADTVGGEAFWDMVGEGRAHDGPPLKAPRRVLPGSTQSSQFACEAVNVPTVMSPWELRYLIDLLLTDSLPHAQLAMLPPLTQRFCNRWQELWAEFGDRPEGWPQFRKALANFFERFKLVAEPIKLRNELTLVAVFNTLIGQVAVVPEDGVHKMPREYAEAIGDRA
ncbi:MAG TPA: aspartyl/asparaginyl beta-hydroxylase domain-containing protein [Xanthomonadaceae bacterium]|jgi:hypothetical protein